MSGIIQKVAGPLGFLGSKASELAWDSPYLEILKNVTDSLHEEMSALTTKIERSESSGDTKTFTIQMENIKAQIDKAKSLLSSDVQPNISEEKSTRSFSERTVSKVKSGAEKISLAITSNAFSEKSKSKNKNPSNEISPFLFEIFPTEVVFILPRLKFKSSVPDPETEQVFSSKIK